MIVPLVLKISSYLYLYLIASGLTRDEDFEFIQKLKNLGFEKKIGGKDRQIKMEDDSEKMDQIGEQRQTTCSKV